MCLYPKLIKNKRYVANKKNGGVIPHCDDERKLLVPAKCNNCIECKRQEARKWQVRLKEELKVNKEATFITLTFSKEELKELTIEVKSKINVDGYELDNEIASLAVRRFTERWRKEHKKTIRHWLVTEIGGTRYEGLHLHGIIWNKENEKIKRIWKYGFVYCGHTVNESTISYITKYVKKVDKIHKTYKAKIYSSKGIGINYINTNKAKDNIYKGENTNENYTLNTGKEINLDEYYRRKIYSEEELEELWLQKLNKEIRYVNGIKIDISNGEEEYYKILEEAQKQSVRMGYRGDKKDWKREQYEKERRNLKIKKKIGLEVKKETYGNKNEEKFWKKYREKWEEKSPPPPPLGVREC